MKTTLILAWLVLCGSLHAAPIFPEDSLLNEEKMQPHGQTYQALVPDTLDLAAHAALSINCLTHNIEPSRAYCVYQDMEFGGKPELVKKYLTWNLPAKNVRALPLLRAMCGSTEGVDVERAIMKTLLDNVHQDGLAYVPVDNDGAPKGTAYPFANGLIAQAALMWQERDHNPEWDRVIQTLSEAMARIAIKKGDRAYFPPESGYQPNGNWLWTTRGSATLPYHPPDEPQLEQQGLEGCVKFEQAGSMRAMAIDLREMHEDPEVKDTLAALTRFCLKPGMWDNTDAYGQGGNQLGIWSGHFHGTTTALLALFDVASLTHDDRLMEVVRRAYEHGVDVGVQPMGWVPGWIRPQDFSRSNDIFMLGETCGVADMLELGVKLSDAGVGDYWDNVDAAVRNHLIAQQYCDINLMRQFSGKEYDDVLQSMVGSFGQGHLTYTAPHAYGCCSANGALALYYAWQGITRYNGDLAQINLFLNRAAPWLDLDSYLPYEGKVLIHNKQAHKLSVRIPTWVDRSQLVVTVDGKHVMNPLFVGKNLLISDLKLAQPRERYGSNVTLQFPISNHEEHWKLQGKTYDIKLRGTTVYDVGPRTTDTTQYQYYERSNLNATHAPMKETTRYVAEEIPALY